MSAAGHLTPERVHKPQRMVLNKGDIWLHDPRIFHRGAPNNSDHTTPNLLMTYRSKASPSPIRGLFGRQFTEHEMNVLPTLGLSDKVHPAHFSLIAMRDRTHVQIQTQPLANDDYVGSQGLRMIDHATKSLPPRRKLVPGARL